MSKELVKGIEQAYLERTDLIVFALTGRTGSGCSTAAGMLARSIDDIAVSDEALDEPEKRKFSISIEFARKQWLPFIVITVSSVIYSFALDEDWGAVEKVLKDLKVNSTAIDEFRGCIDLLRVDSRVEAFNKAVRGDSSDEIRSEAWQFFIEKIDAQAKSLRRSLGGLYQPIFQRFGDNIRCAGSIASSAIEPKNLFSLMRRVRFLIVASEAAQRLAKKRGTRVVIDAIRNPLELVYLRDHFAGLYVIAITVDDDERRSRLTELGLNKREIDKTDEKEYGAKKHLADYTAFVSQNIRDCIQKADIFIANPGKPSEFTTSVRELNTQLVRYVALTLRPGLITPTRDERCMQIAFVAKLNSGCISRQVGAAVADDGYSIQALGWNDVPRGQIPCLLRSVDALLSGGDDVAFSDFEQRDPKLRLHLQDKYSNRQILKASDGLRCPFCFKDAYNAITKKDNQVHTRSLHAEENAFLQLAKRGSSGIAGGILYTTASPCVT